MEQELYNSVLICPKCRCPLTYSMEGNGGNKQSKYKYHKTECYPCGFTVMLRWKK